MWPNSPFWLFLPLIPIRNPSQMIWFIHCPTNRPFTSPSSCLKRLIISLMIIWDIHKLNILELEGILKNFWSKKLKRFVQGDMTVNGKGSQGTSSPRFVVTGSKGYAERASGSPLTSTIKYVPVWIFMYRVWDFSRKSRLFYLLSVVPDSNMQI